MRKVFQLDLGYVLYEDPDYVIPDRYARHYDAVPAWRLNCLYLADAKANLPERDSDVFELDTNEYATIVINAQSGEMIEFMSTDKKRGDYPGFATWEDVGGRK